MNCAIVLYEVSFYQIQGLFYKTHCTLTAFIVYIYTVQEILHSFANA